MLYYVYTHPYDIKHMQQEASKSAAKNEPKIVAEDVRYFEDAHGFLVRPKKRGVYPGVIMIHEFWGLNEHIKNMARSLAAEGYAVFAVDLYHGQVTADSERAMKLVRMVSQNQASRNMRAAVAYLKKYEGAQRIASIGWCFGGGQSLQLALSGEKLNGTIIYYGNLVIDEKLLRKIKWPVLGIFGAVDKVVSSEQVKEFENVLSVLHIENEIYIYPGVGHAFTNPSNPHYAPQESKDAWEKTLAFLNRNLVHYAKRVQLKVK